MKTKQNKNLENSKSKFKVFFAPSGKQGLADNNKTVLEIARSLGVDIDSVCGGRAMCGRCQIEVSEGEFAKYGITSKPENLTQRNDTESRYADKRKLDLPINEAVYRVLYRKKNIDLTIQELLNRPITKE